jgi:hypothetical protein
MAAPKVHSAPPKVRSQSPVSSFEFAFLAGDRLTQFLSSGSGMGVPGLDWPGLDLEDAIQTEDVQQPKLERRVWEIW